MAQRRQNRIVSFLVMDSGRLLDHDKKGKSMHAVSVHLDRNGQCFKVVIILEGIVLESSKVVRGWESEGCQYIRVSSMTTVGLMALRRGN